jgi:hypothetical protein
MSNWPSAWISPISTGLVRWWFGSITAVPPVRFGNFLPVHRLAHGIDIGGAGLRSTAFTHMLKPM